MPSNILWYLICNHLQPSTTIYNNQALDMSHLLDVKHEALQLDVEHRWKTLEANALGNQDVIICGYVVVVFHQHLSYTTNRCQVKFGSSPPKRLRESISKFWTCLHHQKPWGFAMEGVELVELFPLFPYPKKRTHRICDLSSSLLSMRFCIIGIVTLPIFSPLKDGPRVFLFGPRGFQNLRIFFQCEKTECLWHFTCAFWNPQKKKSKKRL